MDEKYNDNDLDKFVTYAIKEINKKNNDVIKFLSSKAMKKEKIDKKYIYNFLPSSVKNLKDEDINYIINSINGKFSWFKFTYFK